MGGLTARRGLHPKPLTDVGREMFIEAIFPGCCSYTPSQRSRVTGIREVWEPLKAWGEGCESREQRTVGSSRDCRAEIRYSCQKEGAGDSVRATTVTRAEPALSLLRHLAAAMDPRVYKPQKSFLSWMLCRGLFHAISHSLSDPTMGLAQKPDPSFCNVLISEC